MSVAMLSPSVTASDVHAASDTELLASLDASSIADSALLSSWALDPWAMDDAAVRRLVVRHCELLGEFSSSLGFVFFLFFFPQLASFHSLGLIRRFALSPTRLSAFIDDVSSRYQQNPFRASLFLSLFHFLSLYTFHLTLARARQLAPRYDGRTHRVEVRHRTAGSWIITGLD